MAININDIIHGVPVGGGGGGVDETGVVIDTLIDATPMGYASVSSTANPLPPTYTPVTGTLVEVFPDGQGGYVGGVTFITPVSFSKGDSLWWSTPSTSGFCTVNNVLTDDTIFIKLNAIGAAPTSGQAITFGLHNGTVTATGLELNTYQACLVKVNPFSIDPSKYIHTTVTVITDLVSPALENYFVGNPEPGFASILIASPAVAGTSSPIEPIAASAMKEVAPGVYEIEYVTRLTEAVAHAAKGGLASTIFIVNLGASKITVKETKVFVNDVVYPSLKKPLLFQRVPDSSGFTAYSTNGDDIYSYGTLSSAVQSSKSPVKAIEWQFASNTNFDIGGLKGFGTTSSTVAAAPSMKRVILSKTPGFMWPSQPVQNDDVYVRLRLVDEVGTTSAWSTPYLFNYQPWQYTASISILNINSMFSDGYVDVKVDNIDPVATAATEGYKSFTMYIHQSAESYADDASQIAAISVAIGDGFDTVRIPIEDIVNYWELDRGVDICISMDPASYYNASLGQNVYMWMNPIDIVSKDWSKPEKKYRQIGTLSDNQTLTGSDNGKILVANSGTPITVNMPSSADPTIVAGFSCDFRNSLGGAITFNANGQTIVGAGTVTNDSTKVCSLYVESITAGVMTIVTVGDLTTGGP